MPVEIDKYFVRKRSTFTRANFSGGNSIHPPRVSPKVSQVYLSESLPKSSQRYIKLGAGEIGEALENTSLRKDESSLFNLYGRPEDDNRGKTQYKISGKDFQHPPNFSTYRREKLKGEFLFPGLNVYQNHLFRTFADGEMAPPGMQ